MLKSSNRHDLRRGKQKASKKVTRRLRRNWHKSNLTIIRQPNNLQRNHLSNKALVLETLAYRPLSHASHLVGCVQWSHIVPSGELAHVQPQMLGTDVVIGSVNPALEHCP